MIRFRPLIPMVFAVLCFIGFVVSMVSQRHTTVERSARTFHQQLPPRPGSAEPPEQVLRLESLQLEPESMYTLHVHHDGSLPVGVQATVVARLLDAEGDELFELEDYYWSETGTWYEDGESGTWYEQNSVTRFNFRVPEAGLYTVEVEAVDLNRLTLVLGAQLLSSRPIKLGHVALGFGAVGFLIAALVTAYRRTKVTRTILESMKAGSIIRLRGADFTVQDVRWHREPGEPSGVEFRLRDPSGVERYLAIETFEHEWTDSEGEDRVRYPRFIMLDLPLGPMQMQQLQGQEQASSIPFDREVYYYDPENSGWSNMETVFEGETYTSRYHARVYLPRPFPKEGASGRRIIEYTTSLDGQEAEWAVMEILAWHDIEFVKLVS